MGEECESEGCGCSSGGCGCGQEQCDCSSDNCCEKGYDKIDMFMYLVHSAKMELVKEKMKKRLEAVKGKKLDQVAELFVEAVMEEWKGKAESEKRKEELREKFESIFKD